MELEELNRIAADERAAQEQYRHRLLVCQAAGCLSAGSDKVRDALEDDIKKAGKHRLCLVKGVGCMGLCGSGPLVLLEPDNVLYQGVAAADAPEIVEHLDKQPVRHLRCPTDTPFFRRQVKIVLENSGRIDPERIEDYIAAGGYRALLKVLTELMPIGVINELTRSGLRGRGGAGYPTGLKLSTVAKAPGSPKYVVCNGDEGDPGAFMDRSVMEGDPHRILEGMAIAAYAVGAAHGYIYVRAEYPLAVERLNKAIRQAQKLGCLGPQILGTTFSFNVEVRLGAGAFVCGEETALIASIEGQRGQPRPRPPYPAMKGLWGCPTLINNVETFANIPAILRNGSEWFASIGTARSKGTKVFALSGKVKNIGLIEVPMGITLEEIIFGIGGGIPDGGRFKAVQTGGPSGGCIPEEHLDTRVDYESLRELGSIMGSGGMIVMDDESSMVEVARYFMEFCMTESCGKCVPCRVGTVQLYDLLTRFSQRSATRLDLERLESLCEMVRATSLCGLGQSAPNPVLSTLRYFRQEYLERMTDYDPRRAEEEAADGHDV
ncbi:MAG: NAD(P)H-dependent oxidoreductase subunit E [Anaerolineae bacterium]|jgi:bidirectional [NiFe] hydrogenase diaphorase subunit|nr:NAD(P)H-dependent oxidoreductase subunit E [Anaerolineae bacterium]